MSNAFSLPKIVRISRLVESVPSIRSEPLVGLAHRQLTFASDEELMDHVRVLFDACRDGKLTPSEALSLVWGSNVGLECSFRRIPPAELWECYGGPTYEARRASGPEASASTESPSAPMPEWWGSRFEAWAGHVAPDLPMSFRRAVGWAVLSALLGEHVATPIGGARVSVRVGGANARVRDEALRLGGTLTVSLESSALASLSAVADRLTFVEPDEVAALEALRERQGPPDHGSDPTLALLISQALDGLERASATAGGPLVVKSSEAALDAVTAFKTDLVTRLQTPLPDAMDNMVSGTARVVRSMAALVAATEGATLVSGIHQAIAIDAATESVRSLVRYLDTERWIAWKV